ncbi:hypothetical protein ES705_48529 [subsurface metagenome]
MFCRKSNHKLGEKAEKTIRVKEKPGVSNIERAPKPVQTLTLETLKALVK